MVPAVDKRSRYWRLVRRGVWNSRSFGRAGGCREQNTFRETGNRGQPHEHSSPLFNPLKVLHVTPSFYPAFAYGGPTYSAYALCRSLARQGSEVRVLTTDANGPDSDLDVNTREG